jgi:hypothetical protein
MRGQHVRLFKSTIRISRKSLKNIDGVAPDTRIDLECQLQRHLFRYVREFRLIVTEKGVILRGRTESYYAKQLAQHTVMTATCLPILANEIVVS